MTFRPKPFDRIKIGTTNYTFSEHPYALGISYGQMGRQSIVWQIYDEKQQKFALKMYHLGIVPKK